MAHTAKYMIKSKKSKFILNTISSLSYELIFLITGFILPKLFITYYGSEVNGLINSITNFLGLIAIADLGIGAVVSANYYKPLSENDSVSISGIFYASRRFYRQLGYILLTYVFVLSIFYPITIKSDFDFLYIFLMIIVIALNSFFRYFFGVANTLLLKSDQKQYVYFFINTITLIINSVTIITLILLKVDILIVKLSTTLIFMIRPILLAIYVNKNYSLFKNNKTKFNIEQKWNGAAQHFAYIAQDNTDIIVISLFSSLTEVSIYSIYNMIVISIRALIFSALSGFSSVLGELIAKKDQIELKIIFKIYEWVTYFMSTLLFGIVFTLIIPFVKIYSSGFDDANYIQPIFAYTLVVAVLFRCIQLPYNTVIQAAMHFKQTQIASILEPVINIVISVILIIKYGLIGIAIGTLISIVYRLIYLIIYLRKRIIMLEFSNTFKLLLTNAFSFIVSATISSKLTFETYDFYNWIALAIMVGIINLVVLSAINFMCFPENFKYIVRYIFGKRKSI